MKFLGLALVIMMAGCSGLFPPDSRDSPAADPTSSPASTETSTPADTPQSPPSGQIARQPGVILVFDSANWTYTWELERVTNLAGGNPQLEFHGDMRNKAGGKHIEDWVINGTTMNVDRQTRWGGGTLRSTCTGDGAGILPLTERQYGCRMDVVRERFDVDFRLIPGSVKTVEVEGQSFVTQNYTLMGTLDGKESVYDAGDYSEELGFWTRMEFALHNGVKFDLVKIEMPE